MRYWVHFCTTLLKLTPFNLYWDLSWMLIAFLEKLRFGWTARKKGQIFQFMKYIYIHNTRYWLRLRSFNQRFKKYALTIFCISLVNIAILHKRSSGYAWHLKISGKNENISFKNVKVAAMSASQWSGQLPIFSQLWRGRALPGIQCKFLTFGPKCQRLLSPPSAASRNHKTFLGRAWHQPAAISRD